MGPIDDLPDDVPTPEWRPMGSTYTIVEPQWSPDEQRRHIALDAALRMADAGWSAEAVAKTAGEFEKFLRGDTATE